MLGVLVPCLEPLGLRDATPNTLLGYPYTPLATVAIAISALLGLAVSLSTFLVIGATSSLTCALGNGTLAGPAACKTPLPPLSAARGMRPQLQPLPRTSLASCAAGLYCISRASARSCWARCLPAILGCPGMPAWQASCTRRPCVSVPC